MTARIRTVAYQGTDVLDIDIQAQLSGGLPAFNIVGLPDKAVAESRERVRSAFHAIGLSLPPDRITVNLAPADVLKEGSHFDLPIALALMVTMQVIPQEQLSRWIALGELALDGTVSKVAGVLPAAVHASGAELGLICPADNGSEAAWAGETEILATPGLIALMNHFRGAQMIPPPTKPALDNNTPLPDLRDIKGQENAKRALEVAAAGGHNLLMIGPPGSGKSMLAQRLPGILPPLSARESLESSMIHSLAGLLEGGRILTARPFRDPHHSASLPALVGGGQKARPGEISLAHNGVLFLDELPEFQRQTLESLRQPMETGRVTVSRANHHLSYPARFQMVAAMNPCRCGWLDDPDRACTRAPRCARDYQARLSGPLLDRIDIHIEVPAVLATDLTSPSTGEASAQVAERVEKARQCARARYAETEEKHPPRSNAEMRTEQIERFATPDAAGQTLLATAMDRLKLSARGYHRLLKLARTIADLDEAEHPREMHIAEALSYRRIMPGQF